MVQLIASLTINPNAPEALKTYLESAMTLIEAAGGRVAQQIQVGDPIIGGRPGKLLMLVNYPSHEAIDEVFESPAYRKLVPIRRKAFLRYDVCLVESNDLLETGQV